MVYLLLIFCIMYPYVLIPWRLNISFEKFYFLMIYVFIMWVLTLLKIIKKEIKLSFPFRRVSWIVLGLFIFISLSTALSRYPFFALYGQTGRYEGYLSLISYLSILFFTYLYVPKEKIELFLKAFVINGIFISIYGILQYYGLDPLYRLPFGTRSFSFFGNPNFFGSYLTLVLPMSIYLFIHSDFYIFRMKNKDRKNRKSNNLNDANSFNSTIDTTLDNPVISSINDQKVVKKSVSYLSMFYFLSASLLFFALILSETRSGWIGSFVAYIIIFFIFVFKDRENKALWIKWMSLSLVFLMIFVGLNIASDFRFIGRVGSTIEQAADDVNKGGSSRVFIWRTTLPLLDDRPILGSGPDTFMYVFPNYSKEVDPYFDNVFVDKAHNEYLQMAITLGFPVLILYLALIVELFLIRRREFRLGLNVNLKNLLLITIVGYLIQAFFNISVVAVAPLYFMGLGLAAIEDSTMR